MHKKLYTSLGLLLLIIVAINFVSNEFHLRFDFTEDGEYTLSEATSEIIDDLEDPVTVKAYFSQNLPPDVAKTRQDFQEMLIEYSNRSNGKVVYEFINPSEKESIEQEANKNGIRTVMINVREKDQVKQQKAFMGALVLPIIDFLQGHGEPTLDELAQARQSLDILYTTQAVTLSDTTDIAPTAKTLVIIRPTDTIPSSHFQKIESFVARGGRVLVAINRVDGNFQNATGSAVNTGLEQWLLAKGIEVEDNFVIDTKCGSVTVCCSNRFNSPTSLWSPDSPIIHPSKASKALSFSLPVPLNTQGIRLKSLQPSLSLLSNRMLSGHPFTLNYKNNGHKMIFHKTG
jgi:ABC-type uncharacterized transport system involved in gliding motility auxiliary subunit